MFRTAAMLLTAVALPSLVQAAPVLDTFSIHAGAYAYNLDGEIRVDGSSGTGSKLDFSKDLGIDSGRHVGTLSLGWRPFERHEFGFSYYGDSASGSRDAATSIRFLGREYPAGASLRSTVSYDVYGLSYTWWGWVDGQSALGIVGGILDYKYGVRIRGSAELGENAVDFDDEISTNALAAALGLTYRRALGEHVRFFAGAGGLKAELDGVDQWVWTANLGVEYLPWENFGFRAQYSGNRLYTEIDERLFKGEARFGFTGLQVLAVARF